MTADTTTPAVDDTPASGRARGLTEAAVTGLLGVLVATAVGLLLAWVLSLLGLTTTPVPTLGPWLAGLGLLGGWQQTVTASVAGGLEWSTWAAGAPLLVTGAVIAAVARSSRRSVGPPAVDALVAAAGAAAGAAVLVLVSRTSTETVDAAGTVVRAEGLTWLWTGGTHPGTLVGAALLVGVTWWVTTAALPWWRAGRALAYGLLLWPGLLLTLVAGGALAYLTSSWAVGLAAVLLLPLLGTLALLSLGGAPALLGVTRLSPEPYDLWTWRGGPLVGLGGLLAVLVVAVIVGLVLRWRHHRGGWGAGVSVPTLAAAFVAWASDTSIVVPDSLGGPTRVAVTWLAAAAVAAVMAVVALAVRGRGGDRSDTGPAEPDTGPAEPDTA